MQLQNITIMKNMDFNPATAAEGRADAAAALLEQLADTIARRVSESVRAELKTVKESREHKEQEQLPRYLTIKEYCALRRISVPTFHRRANAGLIKIVKEGQRTLVPVDSLK